MIAAGSVATVPDRGSDFAGLRRLVEQAGLLRRRRGGYAIRIGLTGVGFVAAWLLFVRLGDSWLQLLTAVALGIAFTQVAFLGHDGGHRQIFASRWANDLVGLIGGDLLVGLSFGWWLNKHNRHHAHPNHEGQDPDIGDGVLAFTTAQADRTGRFSSLLTRNQARLFFPMLTLEGLQLHVASVHAVLQPGMRRYRRLELLLLAAHLVGYLGGVFYLLSPVKALVFLAVHQGIFGLYMGCSFAPNHKGMPTFGPGVRLDFLRRQVLTSRNVRGGWLTDLALGGLNYQIEHHLFPSMPRPCLRRARPLVRAYCARLGLPYTETGLIGSYAAALIHLHALGAPLRAAVRDRN